MFTHVHINSISNKFIIHFRVSAQQVANLYGGGVDKLPLDERAQFAKDNMDNIFATADAPLEPGSNWCAPLPSSGYIKPQEPQGPASSGDLFLGSTHDNQLVRAVQWPVVPVPA